MTHDKIIEAVKSKEYDFLREHEHLGSNLILVGLGGSHGYGTHTPESDIDLRGIATRSAKDILIGHDWETFTNKDTDTTVYSMDKIVSLLLSCNPNTIEMLGLRPDDYLYVTPAGQALIDNAEAFLSKRAAFSFGGYAGSQMRRLVNKSIRTVGQEKHEQHILQSILHASELFPEKYALMPEDALKLYVSASDREDMETEIFMDLDVRKYPLRDWTHMWNEMQAIASSYEKMGHRNSNAMTRGKLAKHQMHLVRLYLMAHDILMDGKIITYREKELEFLMKIRNGYYLDENNHPTQEFLELAEELEERLKYDSEHSPLPPKPDFNRVHKVVANINYDVVACAGIAAFN